jgi:hypothetical protein
MNPMPRSRRPLLSLLVLAIPLVAGCGGPVLEGKVVLGGMSGAELVAEGDPAFDQPGVGGASIVVIRDPDRPNAETVARSSSRADGSFRIPV